MLFEVEYSFSIKAIFGEYLIFTASKTYVGDRIIKQGKILGQTRQKYLIKEKGYSSRFTAFAWYSLAYTGQSNRVSINARVFWD